MAPKDPRSPKSNFRLRQIDQLMRSSWSASRGAKVHAEKREYLANLRGRIDEWLAEPEHTFDLAEGPTPDLKRECWSRSSPPDTPFPFDEGGESADCFFYFSYSDSSEAFTAAQIEFDEVKGCVIGRCGYFVTLLEKVYATPGKTAAHFFSDRIFERHAARKSVRVRHDRDTYVVLADPAGHREGHTMQACTNRKLDKARDAADTLAAKFDIRFLVGRVVFCTDMH